MSNSCICIKSGLIVRNKFLSFELTMFPQNPYFLTNYGYYKPKEHSMNRAPYILVSILIITVISSNAVFSQPKKPKIIEYVRMISEGKEDRVTTDLPFIKSKIQDRPSVSYVEGLLASDGITAIKYFRIVADSFPNNEWGDDALVRIAEIYNNTGMRQPMEETIQRLRQNYPQSPYITSNYISHISDDSAESPQPVMLGEQRDEYAIQLGAFSVRENAVKYQQQLKTNGLQADIFENFLDGKNLLFLVWVGSYQTLQDAKQNLGVIRQRYGVKGIIRTRSSWRRW